MAIPRYTLSHGESHSNLQSKLNQAVHLGSSARYAVVTMSVVKSRIALSLIVNALQCHATDLESAISE